MGFYPKVIPFVPQSIKQRDRARVSLIISKLIRFMQSKL